VLARLMHRAHALGANNPLAAFHGRPEPLAAYFDRARTCPWRRRCAARTARRSATARPR
jgi:hypothetical protein